MPARIADVLRRDGPGRPAGVGETARCILESLALKHAETVDLLAPRRPAPRPSELHVVGGGARNDLLCRWTADASGLPVLAGPEEATLLGNLLVQAIALGEIGSLAEAREVVRAVVRADAIYEPTADEAWQEARERFAALVDASRGGDGVSEHARRSARHPRARRPVGRRRGRRPRRCSTRSTYRSNLLGADRALANIGGGNTSAKESIVDHTGRESRVLWVKGSGTDLATITAAGFAGLRLDELLPLREREAMDDAAMVDYLLRSAVRPGPAAAVDRDAAARVRPGAARRPHAPRRGDRADLDAATAASSPRRRSATRRSGSTTSGPASTCRGGSPMLLEENPTARAVLLEKHGLVTWGETGEESYAATIEFVSRAAHAIDEAAGAASGWGAGRPRSSRTRRSHRFSSQSLPALRGALLADADGVVLEVDRSPEAVAFASAARTPRGEPDRRAVPRPPDQHEAQAARRRRSIRRRDGAAELAAAFRGGVDEYARLVPRLLRAQPRRRDPAVPDRSRRAARRARARASASSRAAPTRAARASRATSTTGRSRSRTRPTRSAASGR